MTNKPPADVNPFSIQSDKVNPGTVAIEQSRAIAEAQVKLLISKSHPRNESSAYENAIQSCRRQTLADSAMYSYPRGGSVISGPSIRLAEELARCWGNIDFGIRELSQTDGVSEMQAYAWDTQTNVISSQNFTVKHERHTRNGVKKLTDPRDIYELCANYAGRRLRARLLAILPPDLVDAAVTECRKTLSGNNDEPMADRVRKMITGFGKLGITSTHIEKRLGHKLDDILPDEFVDLRTIYTTIKDNAASASDFFAVKSGDVASEATKKINDDIAGKTEKAVKEVEKSETSDADKENLMG